MKTINVVAAIIKKDNMILATQYDYGEFKGYWGFPSEKIEPDEAPETTLVRKIKKEFETIVSVDSFICQVEYDYPAFRLFMKCYLCSIEEECLHLLDHSTARWLDTSSLYSINWLPADTEIVRSIEKQGLINQSISNKTPSSSKELEILFEQIYAKLASHTKEIFSPSEGIYRINDHGDYVSEKDFESVFSTHPLWIKYAYLLTINNYSSLEEIYQKSFEEIDKIFNSEIFDPDICYYTEAEEDGTV